MPPTCTELSFARNILKIKAVWYFNASPTSEGNAVIPHFSLKVRCTQWQKHRLQESKVCAFGGHGMCFLALLTKKR